MFDDLPPDLHRLEILRTWHAFWLDRIDRKIDSLKRREREQEHGRRSRPAPPEWIVELGIGTGRPPVQVHSGDCYMAGKRRRAVDRDEARRLLAEGLPGCSHCSPDTQLRILGLSGPRCTYGAAASRAVQGGAPFTRGRTITPIPAGLPGKRGWPAKHV